MHAHNWMIEFRHQSRANMYRLEQTLVSTRSEYQEILITEVQGYGRALFLDGIPQSAALDEFTYHEALIHPALTAHEHPTSVFVAGGGEGAVLREILKHNTVQRVVMVDIDKTVLDLSRIHLQAWHEGKIDDPRVELIAGDALAYLTNTSETFDCIIMDLTDPFDDGVSAPLFTPDFFALANSRLAAGGILSMQAETCDYGQHDAHIAIIQLLEHCFKTVLPYQTFIPFYGLPWGFALASNHDIRARFEPQCITQTLTERGCTDLRLYDAEGHANLFARPKYLRDAQRQASAQTPSNDGHAFEVVRPFS